MDNPFVRDMDGDNVKQLDVLRIIKVIFRVLFVVGLIAALFFSVPTMSSATVGFIVMLFQAFGIFVCIPLVIFLFFYRRHLLTPQDDDDRFTYASRKRTAGTLLIVMFILMVYAVAVWVIHIAITLGYTFSLSW